MKKLLIKTAIEYALIFLLFTISFFILFRSPLFAWQDVLFFRGFYILFVTFFLVLIVLIYLYNTRRIASFHLVFSALVFSISIHLSLFVIFPVTYERSVTMFYLNALNTNKDKGTGCSGITIQESEQKLIDTYIISQKAIEKRLHEQQITGFVSVNDECVAISNRGKTFLRMSEIVKTIYGL